VTPLFFEWNEKIDSNDSFLNLIGRRPNGHTRRSWLKCVQVCGFAFGGDPLLESNESEDLKTKETPSSRLYLEVLLNGS
jgi:hypothetical protein